MNPNSHTSETHEGLADDQRYSLRDMIKEVQMERKESHFGRQLVDSTEIDKMFSKRKRRKKKTS